MKPVTRLFKPLLVFLSTALILLSGHWLIVEFVVASSTFTSDLLVLHISIFSLYTVIYSLVIIFNGLYRQHSVWVLMAGLMVKMFLALVIFLAFYIVNEPLTMHFAIIFLVLYICYLIPFIKLSIKNLLIEPPK
jgi:hypothetical protein